MVPDIVTLAKGLAGGVPMGAMLANETVAEAFAPGTHAATFGGNPLASAAGLYVQQVMDEQNLLGRCQESGAYLGSALARLAERRRPKTRCTRGRGLLQGLVMENDAAAVVVKAREHGLLLSVAGGNVVRFAPPLVVGRAEIDEALSILDAVLSEV
jgi:acetylornithine/succinyldiaminopimelate/putrescine aminotransferase